MGSTGYRSRAPRWSIPAALCFLLVGLVACGDGDGGAVDAGDGDAGVAMMDDASTPPSDGDMPGEDAATPDEDGGLADGHDGILASVVDVDPHDECGLDGSGVDVER